MYEVLTIIGKGLMYGVVFYIGRSFCMSNACIIIPRKQKIKEALLFSFVIIVLNLVRFYMI